MDEPRITEQHIKRCLKLAKGKTEIPAAHAAFWAGSVLIDVAWDPTDQDIAQLAQDAFPKVDTLEIAKAALPIAEAVARIRASRKRKSEP